MARQSFQAIRMFWAFCLSSKRSATSWIIVPRAVEEVSENKAKKESIKAFAVIAPFL
jgi:hypothetical protein